MFKLFFIVYSHSCQSIVASGGGKGSQCCHLSRSKISRRRKKNSETEPEFLEDSRDRFLTYLFLLHFPHVSRKVGNG